MYAACGTFRLDSACACASHRVRPFTPAAPCRRTPTRSLAGVQALQDAGALLVGKTTLHEIGGWGAGCLFTGRCRQTPTALRAGSDCVWRFACRCAGAGKHQARFQGLSSPAHAPVEQGWALQA